MEWNGFKAWMVDGAENLNSAKKRMNETIINIISSFVNFSPFLQALLFFFILILFVAITNLT